MISKELYKEVQKDYIDFKNITQDEYIIIFNKEQETVEYVNKHTWYEADSISIYKLAQKCKEWAYKQGYVILSGHSAYGIGAFFCSCKGWLSENYDKRIEINHNTEPEAIFKACQWILENKN